MGVSKNTYTRFRVRGLALGEREKALAGRERERERDGIHRLRWGFRWENLTSGVKAMLL